MYNSDSVMMKREQNHISLLLLSVNYYPCHWCYYYNTAQIIAHHFRCLLLNIDLVFAKIGHVMVVDFCML